jgi:hypothetical protein
LHQQVLVVDTGPILAPCVATPVEDEVGEGLVPELEDVGEALACLALAQARVPQHVMFKELPDGALN